jgi:hypothetical protein
VRPRGVAAITALLFVVCGMLAAHHEASTAHVVDHAGSYVHARELVGHHTGDHSDIHGQRDPDSDTGECALLTTFHQAASAQLNAPVLHLVAATVATAPVPPAACALDAIAVYRLAPKTSPPAAA